jgi:hypothetical protein
LAALTSRINYFINLSHLIGDDDEFDIPVYLGDASYVPSQKFIGEVKCLTYQISTEHGDLKILLPASAVADVAKFSKTMTALELYIENENKTQICEKLFSIIPVEDLTPEVCLEIESLAGRLVYLQQNKWNGIWARIICNFLTTANLGKFDIIVGNPPWIDWKNLPEGYRDRIKGLCIGRNLFSGDTMTGGINLNICALISNVSAQNWLKPNGTIGFLMPENLIFQQSYEGFRNFYLDDGDRLYFLKFTDWTRAGYPFAPVQHRFLGFYISRAEQDYTIGIPVDQYVKKANNKALNITPLKIHANTPCFSDIEHMFDIHRVIAISVNKNNTAFSYASNNAQGDVFASVAGECVYAGRDGISGYPQELFLLTVDTARPEKNKCVYLTNFQNSKSKHKIAEGTFLLEKEFLFPLIRGRDIERFHVNDSGYVVPFPYEEGSRSPISIESLSERAPKLMGYLNNNKKLLAAQSSYNNKIIGEKHCQNFYALTRVGVYSYAKYFVTFRHNTKWRAAVVSTVSVPWDTEQKRPVFQSHACSISQRPDGKFISESEAHYICAIFNAPVVAEYIEKSSDVRSYKVRPLINLKKSVEINPTENIQHKLDRKMRIMWCV